MVFAEATSVLPLIASDAFHRKHWQVRQKRNIQNLRNMPIWLFHGDEDKVVPVENSKIFSDILSFTDLQNKFVNKKKHEKKK